MYVYKLLRVRKDGTLGSLFINRRQNIPVGVWLTAGDYPTSGFAHRPGWHCTNRPRAPHLSTKGRRWYAAEVEDWVEHVRPANQGGLWYLAQRMKILWPVKEEHPGYK